MYEAGGVFRVFGVGAGCGAVVRKKMEEEEEDEEVEDDSEDEEEDEEVEDEEEMNEKGAEGKIKKVGDLGAHCRVCFRGMYVCFEAASDAATWRSVSTPGGWRWRRMGTMIATVTMTRMGCGTRRSTSAPSMPWTRLCYLQTL